MKKSDWIVIVMFQVIAEMLFMWCIDVSVSAMLNNGIITSGFITSSPMFMYHICLYGSVFNLALLCIFAIHFLVKDEGTKIIKGKKRKWENLTFFSYFIMVHFNIGETTIIKKGD